MRRLSFMRLMQPQSRSSMFGSQAGVETSRVQHRRVDKKVPELPDAESLGSEEKIHARSVTPNQTLRVVVEFVAGTLRIAGTVRYAGSAPGLVNGVMQVNVKTPGGLRGRGRCEFVLTA